jgi:hypothetical protein
LSKHLLQSSQVFSLGGNACLSCGRINLGTGQIVCVLTGSSLHLMLLLLALRTSLGTTRSKGHVRQYRYHPGWLLAGGPIPDHLHLLKCALMHMQGTMVSQNAPGYAVASEGEYCDGQSAGMTNSARDRTYPHRPRANACHRQLRSYKLHTEPYSGSKQEMPMIWQTTGGIAPRSGGACGGTPCPVYANHIRVVVMQ